MFHFNQCIQAKSLNTLIKSYLFIDLTSNTKYIVKTLEFTFSIEVIHTYDTDRSMVFK